METNTNIIPYKVVDNIPAGPVKITRIRTVGRDNQTVELQLEQMFHPPLWSPTTGLLGFTMQGHTSFGNGLRKKVAWLNFAVPFAIQQGIIKSYEEVANASYEVPATADREATVVRGAILVNKDFKLMRGEEQIKVQLVEVDTLEGRSWTDPMTGEPRVQNPKRAGQDGDILTIVVDDIRRPIYRNTIVAAPGADDPKTGRKWNQDLVIVHTNTVVGSSVRNAMKAANMAIPEPKLPAGVTQSQADPALQNQEPGQTSNLLEPTREPTRTQPEDQTGEPGDKTKAQEQREAGERPVGATPLP